MLRKHSEVTLDHPQLPNTDLNMRLVAQFRTRENFISLDKKTPNRIVWTQRLRTMIFSHFVKMLNDGAIQFAFHARGSVCRKRKLGHERQLLKRAIGFGNGFMCMARHQIQRAPKVQCRSNDGSPLLPVALPGPFEATNRVIFPKVDAAPEPIVIITTRLKMRLPRQNPLGNLPAAPVVAENDRIRERFQSRAAREKVAVLVVRRKAAIFGDEPFVTELLARLLPCSSPLRILADRLQTLAIFLLGHRPILPLGACNPVAHVHTTKPAPKRDKRVPP